MHVCARNWYWALTAQVLKWYHISNCTAVTARGWLYHRTAAHYHRRYTVHRTHCRCAQQSNVTYNRSGTAGCSLYHFCRGKENKYCIFWVRESRQLSNTQRALWPIWMYIIFHIITQTARILEKFIKRKTCLFIFSTTFVWNISHSKKYFRDTVAYRGAFGASNPPSPRNSEDIGGVFLL